MARMVLHIEVPWSIDEYPGLVESGVVRDDLLAYLVEEVIDSQVGVTALDIGPGEDAGHIWATVGELVGAELR